ncbi:MAG TPA: hypothetical protein PL157_03425, partial [Acidobacteriota bacterium]|nr:hypothetical protein [Acidobacteriota bacterium]
MLIPKRQSTIQKNLRAVRDINSFSYGVKMAWENEEAFWWLVASTWYLVPGALEPILSKKNQEPRTKNQEPRTKNQEPGTNHILHSQFFIFH